MQVWQGDQSLWSICMFPGTSQGFNIQTKALTCRFEGKIWNSQFVSTINIQGCFNLGIHQVLYHLSQMLDLFQTKIEGQKMFRWKRKYYNEVSSSQRSWRWGGGGLQSNGSWFVGPTSFDITGSFSSRCFSCPALKHNSQVSWGYTANCQVQNFCCSFFKTNINITVR